MGEGKGQAKTRTTGYSQRRFKDDANQLERCKRVANELATTVLHRELSSSSVLTGTGRIKSKQIINLKSTRPMCVSLDLPDPHGSTR